MLSEFSIRFDRESSASMFISFVAIKMNPSRGIRVLKEFRL